MAKYSTVLRFSFIIFILSFFLLGFNSPNNSLTVIEKGNIKYLSNTVVIKLKHNVTTSVDGNVILNSSLENTLTPFGFKSSKAVFKEKVNEANSDLGRIVVLEYTSDADPFYVSSKLKNNPEIEWAEPKFVYEINFIPNDPNYASQYALSKINAALAWDITQGDTSVVIGIIDTGVDWDHPDLAANIWTNWNEIPNNGIDDDGNGFIDDIRGWDFGGLSGTPDNNPMEDRPDHGTHVAGISSAVTNNGIGVASIGFNSRLMPVKTTRDDQRGPNGPYVIFGYEGIVYAADNGAQIINCSWGGGSYSIFGQQVIDYASSKGSLVVAAAGNSNSIDEFYPAAFRGVFSVASTTSSDTKSSFSNYGRYVDVSAPGSNIYNTWQNDTYATLSGTSMASPLVAGLAALTVAQFPTYNPVQIGEQIRVNSDNINSINVNFTDLLGYGRINAHATLSNTNAKSVRAVEVLFSDEAPGGNGDGIFQPGETISVSCNFINYLNPTASLVISLESKNNFSTILNGTYNAGSRSMLEEFNNLQNKFTFTIANNTPQNTTMHFQLKYSDGTYNDYQWISIIANPTYATQFGNDVAMTITSKGTFAFNDYSANTQGIGFRYDGGSNLLFEGALILGTSNTNISDAARGSNQSIQNNDFAVVQPFVLSIPGSIADVQGSAIFNDNNAGANKIGVTAYLNSYSYSSESDKNFIILDYRFVNTNASQVNNFFAGLFFDWDFADAGSDITSWDNSNNYGYVFRNGGSPDNYVGVALLSDENYGFYAIKNDSGDGGFGIYDGFADHEKWQSISNGVSKTSAGPGDISNVFSSGPYSIPANDTIRVAFAVLAAATKADLDAAVQNARSRFGLIVTDVNDFQQPAITTYNLEQNYPNPFNPSTIISWQAPEDGRQTIKVYDVLGNEVVTLIDEYRSAGKHNIEFNASGLASGIYFYKLTAGNFSSARKLVLIR